MISYNITSAIASLLIAGSIICLIRKDLLHTRYSYWWFFVASVVMFAGFFPTLADKIIGKLGVHYPPILIVIGGLGLILVKMLTMDLDRSRQEWKIRRLVQRIAALETEINIIKKQIKQEKTHQ